MKKICKIFVAILLITALTLHSLPGFLASGIVSENDFDRNENIVTESFAELVGTFNGFFGCVDEVMSVAQANQRNEVTVSSLEMQFEEAHVQLEAIHALYRQGVKHVDRWIDDTTIDLSAYGDFWIEVCFETGMERNYSLVDGELVSIEIGFVPSCMETRAIRQSLLAPMTIINATYSIESNVQNGLNIIEPLGAGKISYASLISAGEVPDASLRNPPFRSISLLLVSWPNNDLTLSSAFLTSDRTAVTSAHVVFSAIRGGFARGGTILVATPRVGFGHYPPRSFSNTGWVDAGWVHNQSIPHDQAIIVFQPNSFPSATPLRLTIPTNLNQNDVVAITGYPGDMGGTMMGGIMYRFFGSVVLFINHDRILVSTYASYDGMSGGPIMRHTNHTDVFAIHHGRGRILNHVTADEYALAVIVTQTLIDMVALVTRTHV